MTLESWRPANNALPMSDWMVVREGYLIPDMRLQAIADAYQAWKQWMEAGQRDETCEPTQPPEPSVFALLDALTEEQPVSKFAHGKRDHDELIKSGLLDPDQPTEYATYQTRSDTKDNDEPMCAYCGWSGQGIAKHQLVCKHLSDALTKGDNDG